MKINSATTTSGVSRHWRACLIWAILASFQAFGGTWVPLANLEVNATRGLGPMLLLSDGTVAAQYFGGTKWCKLTPDNHGSYINGAWSEIASMNGGNRQYHSSAVLRDGRLMVAGGELGPGWSSLEVYDPLADSWSFANIPPGVITGNNVINSAGDNTAGFSDSGCIMLADGTVMIAAVFPATNNATVIFDPVSNTCSRGPITLQSQNEATWVKLPDDSILSVDKSSTTSERYIPALKQWIPDASLKAPIYSATGSELGAGFMLPDGRAFFLGGNGNTAYYTPTGNTNQGTWTQGPTMPNGMSARDTPAAMMPNGKILCALTPGTNAVGTDTPVFFYEFNYLVNAFTMIGSPQNSSPGSSDPNNISDYFSMLALPDGNILFSDAAFSSSGSQLYIYQPDCCPVAVGKPAITSVTVNGNGAYHLTGTRLNGFSQGAVYGDDNQMDSNYPLVRTTDASGNTFYGRTYNWSSTGVQTGNAQVSTEFFVGLDPGTYSLQVVANGIASDPVTFFGQVWVDFNYTGSIQDGRILSPYKTLASGVSAAPVNGVVAIKSGLSHETPVLSKPMSLIAVGGAATIGR